MSSEIGLPVYKSTYDLFTYSFELIRDIDKDYKYTVGEKLKNQILELMMNIYRANLGRKRKKRIKKAQENIQMVKILFKVLKDLNQISLKKFARVNKKIEDVSKQITGWHNSLN